MPVEKERDENAAAAEFVAEITGSVLPDGEYLLDDPELKDRLRAAKQERGSEEPKDD